MLFVHVVEQAVVEALQELDPQGNITPRVTPRATREARKVRMAPIIQDMAA